MTSGRRVTVPEPRIAAAVEVLLAGRLTLLQRRALAELLVATADSPATVLGSAVDALAARPAQRRNRSRAP